MCTPDLRHVLARLAGATCLLLSVPAAAAEGPNLGQPVSAQEAAAWDISIGPDGNGLPKGSGTAVQGAPIYAVKCGFCHGVAGSGGISSQLVGGFGPKPGDPPAIKTVGSFWPYATTLFDYIRRAMPVQEPQSLTDDEVYALTAHLLHLNGSIGADQVIDAETLPSVKMPYRDNFFDASALKR